MIRLSTFDFHAPGSVPEALDILARGNGDASILAGGTDLIVGMKQAVTRPKQVVWLGRLSELAQMGLTNEDGLRIGAMCTLDEIEQNEIVRRHVPSLVRVIRSIASPQIRNRATIGGNLCLNTRCFYYDQSDFWRGSLGFCLKNGSGVCHAAPGLSNCSAVFSSDLAPFLMALDAFVRVAGVSGERTISLKDFYSDDGMNHLALRSGDLLTEIIVPSQSMNFHSTFEKLRLRGSIDYPLVNVATTAIVDPEHVIRTIRIIVGAVQSMPIELQASENILIGNRLTLDQIELASEAATGFVQPLPNLVESVLYRKTMVKKLVRKTLVDLMASVDTSASKK